MKDEIIILSERSGWKHLYAFNTDDREVACDHERRLGDSQREPRR